MPTSEPTPDWQQEQHRRIRQRDVTAFAELCEVALPHLIAFLEARFPGQDAHLRETVAIDLLLDYRRRPDQYDARRASLFSYLRMAAKYDMYNQIKKARRAERALAPLDDPAVALQQPDGNTQQNDAEIEEWLQQHTDLTLREVLVRVEEQLSETEQQVLALMLEGVRETGVFAGVLGLTGLDESSQRREVKRVKDRIMQRLRRLGKRVSRHG
ncbi:MAG: hypothetical protein Kow00124_24010 [Anaerolineae bacterium]